jgi:hypothetical protein
LEDHAVADQEREANIADSGLKQYPQKTNRYEYESSLSSSHGHVLWFLFTLPDEYNKTAMEMEV